MKAYRHSVNLKLGLVLFAVLIAVSSLLYTNRLGDRLREREEFVIRLWATAHEQLVRTTTQTFNPYEDELQELVSLLEASQPLGQVLNERRRTAFLRALEWAQASHAADVTSLMGIIEEGRFGIPAIVYDSSQGGPIIWQNVPVPATLRGLAPEDSARAMRRLEAMVEEMAQVHEPIPIDLDYGTLRLKQYIFYDESDIIRELRVFPYVQLLVVGLFVLVGYLGFSYVRRSEQGSLWVGMAKEAAHQLGTPISSLMGWHERLRDRELTDSQREESIAEIGNDIERLNRVTSRFSAIGSVPKLEDTPLAPLVEATASYMRRRIPERGTRVELLVDIPADLSVPLNTELFEWVIENLTKNALDAIESEEGMIEIRARHEEGRVLIDVADSGRGIERRHWKNVFRPGFSTKKRGWGLGLSLAKRIVEVYHGGKLMLLQSRVGQGTTFRIELPDARRS